MSQPKVISSFVAFSGVKWPTLSRPYLMNLVRDVVELDDANFQLSVGDTVDGRYLERELWARIKFETDGLKPKEKAKRAAAVKYEFIKEAAEELSNFLPKIEGRNYHIVVAQRVFDKNLGVEILEAVRAMRSDVRLLGETDNGEYDTEVKVPVRTTGFEEVRAIVPRRQPWFYRIVTSFMQRLINSYIGRTSSPPPSLIVVGCTGTQAYIPYACEGVPSISVPTLRKIDEQLSSENMIGCVVVKIISDGDRLRLIQRTYNFRPIVSRERELVIPEGTSRMERLVLAALKHSPASINTIHFRINDSLKRSKNGSRKPVDKEQVQEALKSLAARDIVVYRKNSNWYAIDDHKRAEIQVTLKELLKGTRLVKHFILSCVHTGALKSLYRTFRRYVPKRAWDFDAIFEVGDHTQDLAHNYEYSGELLSTLLTPDKQEIMAAALRAEMLLEIFKLRLAKWIGDSRPTLQAMLKKCLIWYVFTPGNHPGWKKFRKGTLVLEDFETKLKLYLVAGIIGILKKNGREADYALVQQIVDEKVIRVGENGIVIVDGVTVGVKHPSKARTESKSHRIQDVVSFLWRTFRDLAGRTAKKAASTGFALVYLANFHEMAAVFVSKFGKIILGVMNGAYLKDTEFETSRDKVVDYGFTTVAACLNEDGDLVYADVEFDNYMDPDDAKFVFADYPQNRIPTSAVLDLEQELNKVVDIPWR